MCERPGYLTGSSVGGRESHQLRGQGASRDAKPVVHILGRCRCLVTIGTFAALLSILRCAVASAASCAARRRDPRRETVAQIRRRSAATEAGRAGPLYPNRPARGAYRRKYPIWIDPKEKAVIVDGQISLREGMLEMFACTRNTKEHEAIVSADTKAFLVHTALLSLGAEAGHPAQFQPEYKPPTGTEIEVLVRWKDAQGKEQTARAQDWVKDIHTKKAMAYPFVFGGSSFWTDPESGKKFYQAEGGDFVCVSNFGTAMLDIPVEKLAIE